MDSIAFFGVLCPYPIGGVDSVDFRAAVNEPQIHQDWILWTYINSLGSRGAVQNSSKRFTSAY